MLCIQQIIFLRENSLNHPYVVHVGYWEVQRKLVGTQNKHITFRLTFRYAAFDLNMTDIKKIRNNSRYSVEVIIRGILTYFMSFLISWEKLYITNISNISYSLKENVAGKRSDTIYTAAIAEMAEVVKLFYF